MKAAVCVLATLIGAVSAQSPVYGQCGGSGWTGSTTCVSGSSCVYSNPYYSQCLPGSSGGSTTTKPTTTSTSSGSSSTSSVDTTSHCGQWDTVKAGNYNLNLDLWGVSSATSGSQCANLVSLSGNTVAWKTTWTWSGGQYNVKSYTDIGLNVGLNKQLSAIKSMPSTWTWSYSGSNIVADVAYDLFTSNSAGGSNVNEIMIWLANYNAGPVSAQYGSNGQAVPVNSNLSIAGHTWNLYFGSNGYNNVYSFITTSTITSFSGDINAFIQYLVQNKGVPSSQYLTTAQAGTEPFTGSGTLTTSAYSLVIN